MRFRLLSYVAAMLLLAGVLGVNLTPVTQEDIIARGKYRDVVRLTELGWPKTAGLQWERTTVWPSNTSVEDSWGVWKWRPLIINIAIGLAIPIAGLFACEFVLRRYAPRPKVE